MASESQRWQIRDRHYGVTVASTPDSFDLELDDLGPGVGRGPVAIASMPDGSKNINVRVFTDGALPIEVIEEFVAEARRRL